MVQIYCGFKRLVLLSISRLLTPRGVLATGAALWVGVAALCCWLVYLAYQDAIRLATESSKNLSLAIQRDLERTIRSYDLSLRAVINGAGDPEIMSLPARLRNRVLFDHSATAPYFGTIVLLDANGKVLADSAAASRTPVADFSDRKSYQVQRQDPALGLWISPPHRSKRRPDETEITVSRRVSSADGSFAGVVVGTIDVAYFHSLLDGIDLNRFGSAAIIMTDGSLLARIPHVPSLVGRNFNTGAVFRKLTQEPSGVVWGTAGLDNVRRLYVFKRLETFPLILSVAPSALDILAEWRKRSLLISVLGALFSLVVLPASFLFARELRQRRKAEIALQRQADLDALTELENRGAFDRAIRNACARASRTGTALSLLFLDLDKFKVYNDSYGHKAGDQALRRVAAAANAELQRLSDHFARYGGEEFVAILEGTRPEQAMRVAERIRAATERLGIPHSGSPSGVVTVSIGVAGTQGEASPEALIRMADQALYDAKEQGRNCVAMFSPSEQTAHAPGA